MPGTGKTPVHSVDDMMLIVLSEWEEVLTLDSVVKNFSVRE